MDALNCLKEKEKKRKKRKLTKDFEIQVSDTIKNKKVKTMIDSDKRESNCIKSIVVNSSTTVDVSTRFCKEKMLMLPKMSLKSFVYNIIDIFCFPDYKVKGIFDENDIERCFLYLNLTDSGSCLFLFANLNVVFQKVFLEMFYLKFLNSQKLVQGWTFLTIFGNSLTCTIKERENLWDFMKLKTLIMQISVQLQ